MAMSREDVIWIYRIFLAREPESEAVIDFQVSSGQSRMEMISQILKSDEFALKHTVA